MKVKNHIYSDKTKQVVEKLANRPYRVGLDLGVGSIGYAIGALAENKEKDYIIDEIILSGSRIFTPSSGAADRRAKRGQRNAIRHKSHRLNYLWKILAEKKLMLPFCKDTNELDTSIVRFSERVRRLKNSGPYKLRLKGLSEKLELDEIGYCIYHIANHRGSSSIRTFLDMPEAEQKEAKESAAVLNAAQKKYHYRTFVELLNAINSNHLKGYRNRIGRTDIPIPTRDIIINELDKLLETQQKYHPDIFSKDYCDRIKTAVDFENEKLVPEAGKCPYFPNENKLPKCHFINEERRLWEALNNVRISFPDKKNSEDFSLDEKQILFAELRKGISLTVSSIKKILPSYLECKIILPGKDKETTKIIGFRFKELEEKAFWKRFSENEKDSFIAQWVNCPDDRKLENKLISDFNLTKNEAEDALNTVQLIGDYAPVGKTAMQIINKYIVENGFSWTEAVEAAEENKEIKREKIDTVYKYLPYYGTVLQDRTAVIMGKAWHSAFETRKELNGFIKPNSDLDEEKYGRIANPVVHQSLNELRKIINEMIDLFGYPPAEIALEVARELKVGIERREQIKKDQINKEKDRIRIYETYCKVHNLGPKYIRHFHMMEMQGGLCPYCLKPIVADDIVNHRVDIDHILPEEDTADSSFNNLVLAHNLCNERKGKRIPFSAFSNSSIWPEIVQFIDDNSSMHLKKWRFLLSDEDYQLYLKEKGFLSRYATDNAYIAKAAGEYLSCLFDKNKGKKNPVQTYKGGETAMLRKAWGLQQIGYDIGALHQADKENTIVSGKDRQDNRHHAIDAIVLVYATRSYSKLINTLKGRGIHESFIQRKIPVPSLLKEDIDQLDDNNLINKNVFFYNEISDKIRNQANISIKYDTDKNGELLKATTYSIIGESKENLVLMTKKKVKDIKGKDISDIEKTLIDKSFTDETIKIYDDYAQKLITKYLRHNLQVIDRVKNNISFAEQMLKEQNKIQMKKGRRPIKIDNSSILGKALDLSGGIWYQLSNRQRQKVFIQKEYSLARNGIAVDTGSNLCIDLFYTKEGKLSGEIIRKVYANKSTFIPEYKKDGLEFVERLYQGDTLEVNMTNDKAAFKVKTPISSNERTIVRVDTFTEAGSGIQIHVSNIFNSNDKGSFYLTSMQKQQPRKIVLSPLGYPVYISRLLQNKA